MAPKRKKSDNEAQNARSLIQAICLGLVLASALTIAAAVAHPNNGTPVQTAPETEQSAS